MSTSLENSAVATGLEKLSFHSNPKEGQCQECSNYQTIVLKLARLCSKSFKLGFSSMWIENFQMHKLSLEKAESDIQIVNIHWIIQKTRKS